ncbi:MAG: hotdog fold thioesterase [Alphaproteobacteria bacterium]|nr:hotdog fold thioesterase [Alphaproteobacteria bacterium]
MNDLDALRRFFEQDIPFNAWLGVKVDALSEGTCVLRVPGRRELTGDPSRPALHGGVLSTVADAAGGLAVFSRLDLSHACSTVDLRVDYLRPGHPDRDLLCGAEVVRLGNRVAVTTADLWQDDPAQPIAQARAVYNIIRRGREG